MRHNKSMKRRNKKSPILQTSDFTLQKGVSLYLALIIMFILIAIALGVSLIIVSQMKMMKGMGDSVVAFYAADTGIEQTLYQVRGGGWSGDISGSVDGASYYVTSSASDTYQSKGSFANVKRAIEIYSPPPAPLPPAFTLSCNVTASWPCEDTGCAATGKGCVKSADLTCTPSCPDMSSFHASTSTNNCTVFDNRSCRCKDLGGGVYICIIGSGDCSVTGGQCYYYCDPGWCDLNADPSDGCESPC
jgi:hypothetical protein